MVVAPSPALSTCDRTFLFDLQRQAVQYFLDNQTADGLVLDRQRNFGARHHGGVCSLTATGMGAIALALAAAPPFRLLPAVVAARRIAAGLETVLNRLPHHHGILPHFVDAHTLAVYGSDVCSTVDTAWLAAGALWAATFLRDPLLALLAGRVYDRIDWRRWTASNGLLRHGQGVNGRLFDCTWDRWNGETAFLYVLAAGADEDHAVPTSCRQALRTFEGEAGGLRFGSADLGLFVFQYGLDLLDLPELWADAALAVEANQRVCRAADCYLTYRRYWGLSAGDGPGDGPALDSYRAYSPSGPIDGTAHLTASAASVAHDPGAVFDNLYRAERDRSVTARGRYGFSCVNLDRHWVGGDMIGIDAGALVLALDNVLAGGRVREVFHDLPCVAAGCERLGLTPRPERRIAA